MLCPLCDHPGASRSWAGTTFYGGQEYTYLQCRACLSIYADPVPKEEALTRMYGPEQEIEFRVRETAWPAPDRLRLRDLAKPRTIALFLLAWASRAGSSLSPGRRGSCYFYADHRDRDEQK